MAFSLPFILFGCKRADGKTGPRRPFPYHKTYVKGVILPNDVSRQALDDSTAAFYKLWKQRYIKEDPHGGDYVWFENTRNIDQQCVSEGQGYGMLITVLMAGLDSNAHKTYDALYQYYKLHPSRNPFLMAWAQNHKGQNTDTTSATDGDLDIAASLIMAHKQWGDEGKINYLKEAGNIMQAIKTMDMNRKTHTLLTSNAVEDDSPDYFDTRSSDFMPAHFKIFRQISGDKFWDSATDSEYALFLNMQERFSQEAGLIPDFIEHVNKKPRPARPGYMESPDDGQYNFNACRDPWRLATDYILNGDGRAYQEVSKIDNWIRNTTSDNPDNISAGYRLSGNDINGRNYEALCFIVPFSVAAMVDAKNQLWLNRLWKYTLSFPIADFDYYDNSIKMIGMIIMSGNYWE